MLQRLSRNGCPPVVPSSSREYSGRGCRRNDGPPRGIIYLRHGLTDRTRGSPEIERVRRRAADPTPRLWTLKNCGFELRECGLTNPERYNNYWLDRFSKYILWATRVWCPIISIVAQIVFFFTWGQTWKFTSRHGDTHPPSLTDNWKSFIFFYRLLGSTVYIHIYPPRNHLWEGGQVPPSPPGICPTDRSRTRCYEYIDTLCPWMVTI